MNMHSSSKSMPLPPDVCCVCWESGSFKNNRLVYCDGMECDVIVHQQCYGISIIPEEEWLCVKCSDKMLNVDVECSVCPSKEGALKRTVDAKWVHVVCALYIPEIRFLDVVNMEPIDLSNIKSENLKQNCYFCLDENKKRNAAVGVCIKCNKTGCQRQFHVTCAHKHRTLREIKAKNVVKYVGFCKQHMRKNTNSKSQLLEPSQIFSCERYSDSSTTTLEKNGINKTTPASSGKKRTSTEDISLIGSKKQSNHNKFSLNWCTEPLPPLECNATSVIETFQDKMQTNRRSMRKHAVQKCFKDTAGSDDNNETDFSTDATTDNWSLRRKSKHYTDSGSLSTDSCKSSDSDSHNIQNTNVRSALTPALHNSINTHTEMNQKGKKESTKKYATRKQKDELVELIRANFLTLFGRHQTATGTKTKAAAWKNVAEHLNRLGPPRKTVKQWQTTWNDIKKLVKEKIKLIKQHTNRTGGGAPCSVKLSYRDENILSICGKETITGNLELPELGVRQHFTEKKSKQSIPCDQSEFYTKQQTSPSEKRNPLQVNARQLGYAIQNASSKSKYSSLKHSFPIEHESKASKQTKDPEVDENSEQVNESLQMQKEQLIEQKKTNQLLNVVVCQNNKIIDLLSRKEQK